jgi:hypothetical protein
LLERPWNSFWGQKDELPVRKHGGTTEKSFKKIKTVSGMQKAAMDRVP